MKKPKKAPQHEDQDPVNGKQLAGCLFVGITLLLLVGYVFSKFIGWIK
jgi:hypothetical protein